MTVRWARRARRRLEEIYDYIAAEAPERGAAFCERLIAATEQLEAHPFSGSLLPEDRAYRQLIVEGYRLVYRVAPQTVYVVNVAPGMLLHRRSLTRR